jgi:hypothetical protein
MKPLSFALNSICSNLKLITYKRKAAWLAQACVIVLRRSLEMSDSCPIVKRIYSRKEAR